MSIKRFALLFVLLILVAFISLFFAMGRQVNQLEKQDFGQVDVASLPDGIYQGSASTLLVTARVEVSVKEGRIQHVALLEHRHGAGHGAEAIAESIVQTNSPDVDGISGATASSTVVKSAVLEALRNGATS